MFISNCLKKQKGFSLVELLTTVSVVGILSALSIVNYNEYRIQAYNAQALIMFDQLMTMKEAVVADFNESSALTNWPQSHLVDCWIGGAYAGNPRCQGVSGAALPSGTTPPLLKYAPEAWINDKDFTVRLQVGSNSSQYIADVYACKGTLAKIGGNGVNYVINKTTAGYAWNNNNPLDSDGNPIPSYHVWCDGVPSYGP